MVEYSQDFNEKFINELKKRNATLPCPRCGKTDFSIVGGFFMRPIQNKLQGIQIGGNALPTMAIVCTNCGYISEHALGVLNLLGEETK